MLCRFCKKETELLYSFPKAPIASQYTEKPEKLDVHPLDLCGCECGYVGLDGMVDLDGMYRDHGEITSNSSGLVRHFQEYCQWVVDRLDFPQIALVLDIGSNDGTFLSFFKKRGLNVLGVEPSEVASGKAESRGIPTMKNFFTTELVNGASHISAQVITANRVWANVYDLIGFVANVKKLLAPDGVFIVETGYLPAILDNLLVETVYHEHITYDTLGPIANFLQGHGLTVTHAEINGMKGGSLRLLCQQGFSEVDSTVGAIIKKEREWLEGKPWDRFKRQFEDARDSLREQIKSVDHPCGYGGGIPGAALIYHLGLQDTLEYVIDDDPRFWGKHVAGTNIQVRPPTQLVDSDTRDVAIKRPQGTTGCLILAHRYADQIKKAHPEHDNWIVPFQNNHGAVEISA